MDSTYLLDSNIVIDLIAGNLDINNPIVKQLTNSTPIISVISKIELLAWNPPNTSTRKVIAEFIQQATILPLTDIVASKTVDLRRRFRKNPKLPDAVIAATAIIHNCILVTNDRIGFHKIEELEILNPYKV